MKQLRTLVGVSFLLAAVSASAQITHEVHVNVPFQFVAGSKISPPGSYRLHIDPTTNLVRLVSPDLKSMYLLMPRVDWSNDARTYVRFRRYGQTWFLEQISIEGTQQKLFPGKAEKRMIEAARSQDHPIIADLAIH